MNGRTILGVGTLVLLAGVVSCAREDVQAGNAHEARDAVKSVHITTQASNKAANSPKIERTEPALSAANSLVEIFPGVRVNRETHTVEFDAMVSIDAHNLRPGVRTAPAPKHAKTTSLSDKPIVYLELIACAAGTKDHESIVSTKVPASQIHAGLLMVGAEPGAPGTFRWEDTQIFPVHPAGDSLDVSIIMPDGSAIDARELVIDVRTGETLGSIKPHAAWVFAGSKIVEHRGREVYAADGTGIIIGLATFGTEVAGYARTFSHESNAHTPVWIANHDQLPEYSTSVVVRFTVGEDTAALK